MHKLLKEYFLVIGGTPLRSNHFEVQFCQYFSNYIVKHITKLRKFNVTDFEQYEFKLEHQNAYYLMDKLLQRGYSNHSITEIQALAFAVAMDMLNKDEIESKYVTMLSYVSAVCNILDEDECGNLYSHIIHHVHEECGCRTVMDIVGQLFIHDEYPCEDIFTCKIVSEIYLYDSIWKYLTHSEYLFLIGIIWFHCMKIFAVLAALVNLSVLLSFSDLICPATILAPKNTACSGLICCNVTILTCVLLCWCVLIFMSYLIVDNVITVSLSLHSTVVSFLVFSILGIIYSTLNIMCRPISNRTTVIFAILYILATFLWIFFP